MEACLYAVYPVVMMEETRRVMTGVYGPPSPLAAPMNQFAHVRDLIDDKFDWVVRPNAGHLIPCSGTTSARSR